MARVPGPCLVQLLALLLVLPERQQVPLPELPLALPGRRQVPLPVVRRRGGPPRRPPAGARARW